MNPGLGELPVGSVQLERIVRDPQHVSPRLGLGDGRVSAERVAEFKRMLHEDLESLPRPICVESQGSLILADGHHRAAAYEQLAREHSGDRRFQFICVHVVNAPAGRTAAAFAYEIALECSAKGPLPLSRAEKQAAIRRLITEHPDWSDREIARRVGVDHKTVGTVRRWGDSPSSGVGRTSDRDDYGSPTRLSRIAAQLVRYGDEVGTEESTVDHEELVSVLATKLTEAHPTTAPAWAEWWRGLFDSVSEELEALER